jgi:PAS domain S-box-containing protein
MTEDFKQVDDYSRKIELLEQSQAVAKIGSWEWCAGEDRVFWTDQLFYIMELSVSNDNYISQQEATNFIHPADKHVVAEIAQLIQEQELSEFDFRWITNSGKEVFIHSWCQSFKNEEGTLSRVIGTCQDISRLRETEGKLERRSEALRLAEETAGIGSWKSNMVTGQRFYSEHFYRLLSQDPADVQLDPQKVLDLIVCEDKEKVALTYANIMEDGISRSANFRIVDKNGDTRYFTSSGKISTNKKGEKVIAGMIQDITTAHILQLQLQSQKDFVEQLVDSSVNCISVLDDQLRFVLWNKKCEQFYGIPREKVLGKRIEELFPELEVKWFTEASKKVIKGEPVIINEMYSVVTEKCLKINMLPIYDQEQNVSHVFTLVHDITDLKQTEEKLRFINTTLQDRNKELFERNSFLEKLLDTSSDMIGAYDKDLRILVINKATEERFGIRKEDVIGKHVLEAFPLLKSSERIQDLKDTMEGKEIKGKEVKSDLGDWYFINHILPLRDMDGAINGALTLSHDITDFKKTAVTLEDLNRELRRKNDQLERMNSELTSFSFVASHDLQEPLRKILAFTSLIMARDAANISEAGKDYFERIKASANRMQLMIEGLLGFSRTNTTPKVFAQTDLHQLMEKVLTIHNKEITETGASITIKPLPVANIIPHQFEQLLDNLLSNALKFQPKGRRPVVVLEADMIEGRDIEGDVASRGRKYLKLSIKDNGVGFEEEQAEKIFQMFHRLHGKSEYPGTGIGLAICRKIIENHDGLITTESRPDEGSVFNIFIPVEEGKTNNIASS